MRILVEGQRIVVGSDTFSACFDGAALASLLCDLSADGGRITEWSQNLLEDLERK